MECPKCHRQMTDTTPTKAYCMKCDILIHLPSGVAFTGRADEDKFIAAPAIWFDERRKDVEVTAAQGSLILTWKEGKVWEQRKIPYTAITGVDLGKRQYGTEGSAAQVAVPVIGALFGPVAGSIALVAAHSSGALDHASDPVYVQTLLVRMNEGNLLFMSHPSDWADRLCREAGLPTPPRTLDLPPAVASLSEEDRRTMVLCPQCGEPIARAAFRCGSCGESMEKRDLGSQPTIQELIKRGKIAG